MNDSEKSPEQLQKENKSLREELGEYKALKEDLMARRVTKKVMASFSMWVKVVGIIGSLATTVGIGVIVGYVLKMSKAEIKTQVDAMVPTLVSNLTPERVSSQVQTQLNSSEMIVFIHKQVQIQLASTKGISGNFDTNAVVTSGAGTVQTITNIFDVDYSDQMLPVRSQGQEGSVVGFACAAALEYQVFKSTGKKVSISPRYIYNMVRPGDRWDSGATIYSAIQLLQEKGAVEESAWPYISGEFSNAPPPTVTNAKKYFINNVKELHSVNDFILALKDGPSVMGITIFDSFPDQATNGVIVMPNPTESGAAGHAICIVGYSKLKKLFKFKNSWGADWGDHGYGYLPFDYVERYSNDSYSFKYDKLRGN